MNNWGGWRVGERERCVNWPLAVFTRSQSCSGIYLRLYTAEITPARNRKGLKLDSRMVNLCFPLKHGAWVLQLSVCVCAWVCTNECIFIQPRVSLRLHCTYPTIPTRPPHSAAVHGRVCVCVEESIYICVWVCESVNEFYALLVSFKDPGESQWRKRLLPCRLDPIQLLKDVEWLQWGPVQSVSQAVWGWWALETLGNTTTHALAIPCHVAMVSGECRWASWSMSVVIPPCLAALFVCVSVCVWQTGA